MRNWSFDDQNIESQADEFASYLLMPLDDLRQQVNADVNLDILAHCANRYGVSLTAAALKWLSYTDQKAVFIVSTDGYINWARSRTPAAKSGAYFKTKGNVIIRCRSDHSPWTTPFDTNEPAQIFPQNCGFRMLIKI